GMSGIETAGRLQRLAAAPMPIVLLRSVGGAAESALAGNNGIAVSLNKPVRQTDLLQAIRMVLENVPINLRYEKPDGSRSSESPLSILLAEDNPINRTVALRMLEKFGHRVQVAENGAEAVAAAEADTFDAILMDIQMPDMDGFQATAAIRARECVQGGRIPIIAMIG